MPEINKSQAIRDYYKKHPKAKAREVVEALAKNHVTVSGNLVTTVKSKHNTRRRRCGRLSRREASVFPKSKRPWRSSSSPAV